MSFAPLFLDWPVAVGYRKFRLFNCSTLIIMANWPTSCNSLAEKHHYAIKNVRLEKVVRDLSCRRVRCWSSPLSWSKFCESCTQLFSIYIFYLPQPSKNLSSFHRWVNWVKRCMPCHMGINPHNLWTFGLRRLSFNNNNNSLIIAIFKKGVTETN